MKEKKQKQITKLTQELAHKNNIIKVLLHKDVRISRINKTLIIWQIITIIAFVIFALNVR